ncbi:MAG TPA: hypothetical protein VHG93_07840 [Longimicrobium sp.]|nr:hypothetical protein [Longimicrobium sp.]
MRTHLWVAQQVLNDVVPDGRVTLAGREYPVPADRVHALRNHPRAYRMGHIGPDAHPDVLVGQGVVHPGDPWPVDAWLRHVIAEAGAGSGRNVAYAYGYLGHAAADVWAHTYVNLYAGSVFDVTAEGLDGEIRHLALEGYIDQRVPELRDWRGERLAAAEEHLFDAPHDFLRDALIVAPAAAGQYARRPEASAHLVAMRQAWLAAGDLRTLVHELATVPPALESGILGQALEAGIRANDHLGILQQQRRLVSAARAALQHRQELIRKARDAVTAQRHLVAAADGAVARFARTERRLIDERARVQAQLIDLSGRIAGTPAKLASQSCSSVRTPCGWLCGWVVKRVCRQVSVVNDAYTTLTAERTRALHRKNALQSELSTAAAGVRSAGARRTVAAAGLTAAEAQMEVLDAGSAVLQRAVDQAERAVAPLEAEQERLEDLARWADTRVGALRDLQFSLAEGAIDARLAAWEGDMYRAMLEYEIANTGVMRGAVGSGSVLQPLQTWVTCWGPVFATVPREVPELPCGASAGVTDGLSMVRRTNAEIAEAAGNLGWLIDPQSRLGGAIEERLRPKLVEAERQILNQVGGGALSTLVLMMHEPVDAKLLDGHFSVDRDGEGILLIPDMAARADSDMYVRDGRFDDTAFHVAANAVTLSKLALLDAAGMRQLLTDLGLSGAEIAEVREPFNVLFASIHSIDGSHQWIGGPAPEYPRRHGRGPGPSERQFGADAPGTPGTLVWMFSDQRRREAVFERLFSGPVAPALETAPLRGFRDVLPAGYPRGTPQDPFVS